MRATDRIFTEGKMVENPQQEAAADPSEFVRAWALADGTRCVLAVVGPLLELRIVSDDLIVRHARFTEMQRARMPRNSGGSNARWALDTCLDLRSCVPSVPNTR